LQHFEGRWFIDLQGRIGDASVKIFLPIFMMNFPEIVDIALPAEGFFHNLVFVSIRKSYPMQAYKVITDGHQARPPGLMPVEVKAEKLFGSKGRKLWF
jgi:UbiD family decarboxylase